VEEMSRPGDATGNSWHVSDNWWHCLESLILVLNRLNFSSIVMEKDGILCSKAIWSILEVFSFEDCLELSEEFQRIFDAGDNLEVLVNVSLEFGFNS